VHRLLWRALGNAIMRGRRKGSGVGNEVGGGYDAFLSYSHAADGQLAPRLQSGLQRFATPWWRRQSLRVFRDETGLSANPHLWSSISTALDSSQWLVLLASPEAAASDWVGREIEHWLATKPGDRILVVLTDGTLVWDRQAGRFDPDRSTAAHRTLVSAFREEPRFIDLTWAKQREQIDRRDGRFQDALAEVAATLHGRPKDELAGEDVRLHRRTMRTAKAGVAALGVLTAVALMASVLAIRSRHDAREQATIARARLLADQATTVAGRNPSLGLLLAVEGVRAARSPETLGGVLGAFGQVGHLHATVAEGRGDVVPGVSGDGSLVAVARDDATVDVIGFVDHEVRATLRATGADAVANLALDSSGKHLAVVTAPGAFELWDVDASTRIARVDAATSGPAAIEYSPDDQLVVTAASDGTAKVWNQQGQVVRELKPFETSFGARFTIDSKRLILNGAYVPGAIVDIATGTSVELATSDPEGPFGVVALPDGATLVVSNLFGGLTLNDAVTAQPRSVLVPDGKEARFGLDVDSKGTTLVSGLSGGTIVLLDLETGAEIEQFHALPGLVDVRFAADDRIVARAPGTVALWDRDQLSAINERFSANTTDQLRMAVAPDHRHAIVQSVSTPTMAEWDLIDRRPTGRTYTMSRSGIGSVAWSPLGRTIASVNSTSLDEYASEIELFDVETGRVSAHRSIDNGAFDIQFSPDGTRIAVYVEPTDVIIVDASTLEIVHQITGMGPNWELAWRPDGSAVWAAAGDLYRIDPSNGNKTALLPGDAEVYAVAADGVDRVLMGVDTSFSSMTADGEVEYTVDVDAPVIDVLPFAPLNSDLAFTTAGSMYLIDRTTQRAWGPGIPGHSNYVRDPANLDDRHLVTTGSDGHLTIWDLDPAAWLNTACRLAGRNLTRTEMKQYLPWSSYHRTCDQWPGA
jgi:WD40 repeat protein